MTIQYQKTLLIGFITSILVAELAIASDQRDFSTSDHHESNYARFWESIA